MDAANGDVDKHGNSKRSNDEHVIFTVSSTRTKVLIGLGALFFLVLGMVIGVLVWTFAVNPILHSSKCSQLVKDDFRAEEAVHDDRSQNHHIETDDMVSVFSRSSEVESTTPDNSFSADVVRAHGPMNSTAALTSTAAATTTTKSTTVPTTTSSTTTSFTTETKTTSTKSQRTTSTTTAAPPDREVPREISQECETCETRDPFLSPDDLKTTQLFAPLSIDEMNDVYSVLKKRNIIMERGQDRNYMKSMYLDPPKKAKALDFLDNGGPFPGRYARVHVIRGAHDPQDIMEYSIGPTSASTDDMVVKKLKADGEIPYTKRSYDRYESSHLRSLVSSNLRQMKTLLKESFGGATYGDGISYFLSASHSFDQNDRVYRAVLYLTGNYGVSATQKTLPVHCTCHCPGRDKSKWYCSDFFYLNQGPYTSGKALMDAFNSDKNFRKIKLGSEFKKKYDKMALRRDTTLPEREEAERPPPRLYEPNGPRYTIQGQRIKWMGWQFEFTSNQIRGPSIFDVRFQNQRIAYEISLNDITLAYSSGTGGAGVSPSLLSDTLFNLGRFNTVKLGVDCPVHAKILRSTRWKSNTNAGCIFEAGGQEPLWRHGGQGLLNHYLIVRVPMVLGNYDYTVDFKFYLDGRLVTDASASGHLYASFWDPDDTWADDDKSSTAFGFRVSDFVSGSLHDHTFLFKVDLDVVGTKNSFEVIKWKGGDPLSAIRTQVPKQTKTEALKFFPFNSTRYVDYDIVREERGFVMNPREPAFWTVVNEKERNVWGVKRGYQIIPTFTALENLPAGHPVYGVWSHLKSHITVTKRKDSEIFGTESIYDMLHPWDPIGGVDKMLNNESIRKEDLVVWVSVKFIHLPTSEDIPVTRRVDNGFILKPFNYFDKTAVFDLPYTKSKSPHSFKPCYENV